MQRNEWCCVWWHRLINPQLYCLVPYSAVGVSLVPIVLLGDVWCCQLWNGRVWWLRQGGPMLWILPWQVHAQHRWGMQVSCHVMSCVVRGSSHVMLCVYIMDAKYVQYVLSCHNMSFLSSLLHTYATLFMCVGSLVPFSLRLLHAQLPLWTADPSLPLAVDRVYSIKSTVSKVCTLISQVPRTGSYVRIVGGRSSSVCFLWY